MNLSDYFSHELINWFIIPFLIFCARILDVSIGTLRVIFVARGLKFLAPMLGFFEVLIWLLAIGQILQNLTNWQNYLAYASGFATGNYIGMVIENKLALGKVILRIITRKEDTILLEKMREASYGMTVIPAEGKYGPVQVMFTVVYRQELRKVIDLVHQWHPHAFYSIEDVRYAHEGVFPLQKSAIKTRYFNFWELLKKTK